MVKQGYISHTPTFDPPTGGSHAPGWFHGFRVPIAYSLAPRPCVGLLPDAAPASGGGEHRFKK